ncbi:MAG: CidB/LrgB family autolysis modulator [Thermococcus sp.]|uniref:CidB/LrgB family autolysis modulator n=1 Tax=Thermococcus sp. TaxID=35749 RepID=UPI002623CAB5|nr:CidB/LrgB family autolysis modulator [Thermococcus sp.]MCD6139478.1 CidB/LrgB family autolysis modulator [Thermococcus sp.]MCD6144404.1 CidB/LrgB family autolysis modulator [Thermococcus sp.]
MNSLGIFITIGTFYLFSKIYEKRKAFYLNPVLLSIITIALFLHITEIKYETYMESAQILSFLLGPAVVSLAIPLYKQREIIKAYSKQIFFGIIFGGVLAILSAFYVAKMLGGTSEVLLSIAPKSITTAIAIGVSEKIGGIPPLTAVLVILTGILGNAVGIEILNISKVKDKVARGLAMGVTSHGLGTARIILDDELSGAVSGLAMALNGIFTSLILPYLIKFLK